jgi:DNA-3-methyladenine glycosylase II
MPENILSIPLDTYFNFSECLWYLDRNYDDCMHKIIKNRLYKALLIHEMPYLICIVQKSNFLEIELLAGEYNPEADLVIRNHIAEWFDLGRNVEPFYKLLYNQPQLSYMAEEFKGLRIIGIPDLFEALCWSIIGQQINLSFAYRLKRRLVEKYGTHIEFNDEVFYIFPKYEVLAKADPEDLRTMQLSTRKADYLIGLARTFAAGKLSKEILLALPNLQARQKLLMSLKGIGIWTANYVLMKSLKEQSSIPYGDSGLIQALLSHHIITDKKDTLQIQNFFQAFEGWESYTVFYLWRSLAKKFSAGY